MVTAEVLSKSEAPTEKQIAEVRAAIDRVEELARELRQVKAILYQIATSMKVASALAPGSLKTPLADLNLEIGRSGWTPRAEILLDIVASEMGVDKAAICSKSKCRKFTLPRHVIVYFLYRDFGRSCQDAADMVGLADHAMTVYATKVIRNRSDVDLNFRRLLIDIRRKVVDAIETSLL